MPEGVPFVDHDSVLAAVSPAAAIDAVRDGFVRHRRGEWAMPSKVYLDSQPHGDFRAMPARGSGLAMVKWICSFPNPAIVAGRRPPTVSGMICLNDATTGEFLMLMDARSVTALRTGAGSAVAALTLARPDAATASVIGCGVHGRWTAICLAAAGYTDGVAHDPSTERAEAVAAEVGWRVGTLAEALAADVVTCVTPGHEVLVTTDSLRPGQHLNMVGADGPGKAEATVDAVLACTVFCDEWHQASHGGEITAAVTSGRFGAAAVTELGAVLVGHADARPSPESITLFDSTGLAIQDLAIAAAVHRAWQAGGVEATTVPL